MKKLQKKMKIRIWCLWGLLILSLAFMVVVGELSSRGYLLDSRATEAWAQSLRSMIFFGWLIYLAVQLVRSKKLLKNSFLLQEQEWKEEDERRRFINGMSGNLCCNLLLAGLLAAVVLFSFIDMTVFRTLVCVLACMTAVKLVSLAWYRKKY